MQRERTPSNVLRRSQLAVLRYGPFRRTPPRIERREHHVDHDIDVEGRAASVTPTPEEGTSTTSSGDQAPTRTSASRRRRRGGRGRGRGRSGAAAASATKDVSGDVATTPAEPSEGSAVLRAEADAPSEAGRPAETSGTSKPKSVQRSGQPRRRKPAGSTATTATGDPSEATGSP